ncbi:MAG: stage II sporulation protein D [Oscillospiraceae bacterium]|nr:stage II sporulation protein D [Oscillospiraceae bacterium]
MTKKILIVAFAVLILTFLMALAAGRNPLNIKNALQAGNASPAPTSQAIEPQPTAHVATKDSEVSLTVLVGGDPKKMPLNEYLYGAVSAEMPALYPIAALQSQAVAARTYALYAINKNPRHDNAVICGDFACCMAWRSEKESMEAWGQEHGNEYYDRIKEAVDSTDMEVLLYNNELIDALFFAFSSGKTESAAEVWGNDIPYLVSVESDWDKEHPEFTRRVSVKNSKARKKLEKAYPGIKLPKKTKKWFSDWEYTASGRVKSVRAGDTTVAGTEIRSLFGLSSHHFTVSFENSRLNFVTQGFGHGVGLSQFGARQMSQDGKDYKEILAWYYKGTTLERYKY